MCKRKGWSRMVVCLCLVLVYLIFSGCAITIDQVKKWEKDRAVEPLIAALQDENEDLAVRETAAKALGNIGDTRAVEPLIAQLNDDGAIFAYIVK